MGKHPKIENLSCLFHSDETVQLTDEVYHELTGAELPKSKSYLFHDSALAKLAKRKGYKIVEVQEEPIIRKTIVFIKVKEQET